MRKQLGDAPKAHNGFSTARRWMAFRFRLALAAGIAIACFVAAKIYRTPTASDAILDGTWLWLSIYSVLYLRRTSAQIANSQRELWGKFGFTNRKAVAAMLLVVSCIFILALCFHICSY